MPLPNSVASSVAHLTSLFLTTSGGGIPYAREPQKLPVVLGSCACSKRKLGEASVDFPSSPPGRMRQLPRQRRVYIKLDQSCSSVQFTCQLSTEQRFAAPAWSRVPVKPAQSALELE
jgi:hypothetical protein